MDLFPTNLLSNVLVIKSARADLPADFTGGVIDIITETFHLKKKFQFQLAHHLILICILITVISPMKGVELILGFVIGTRK